MSQTSAGIVGRDLAAGVGVEERRMLTPRERSSASEAMELAAGTVEAKYECPRCGSQDIWRNGFNGAGNQQFRCKTCGRVFVLEPYKPRDIRLIADRMLQNEIAVPIISEVLRGFLSRRWLYERRKALQERGEL